MEVPGAYDPETRLYIFGTGNPTPAYTPGRGEGDNLFTCSLVAVNVDTGKMAWYFQTSPHDMHDWDSAQTPILIDGVINGRKRKLVSTAARNGYFFTLDRVTGDLRRFIRLMRGRQLALPGRIEASLNEHRVLMDAFVQRDAPRAEREEAHGCFGRPCRDEQEQGHGRHRDHGQHQQLPFAAA